MKILLEGFNKFLNEKPLNEGKWGYERVDPEFDRRGDTLGGHMASLLVNSPAGRIVQNDFNLPPGVEEEVIWTDEVKSNIESRRDDILQNYEQMLGVLEELSNAEQQNSKIGSAFQATNDWYQTTKGEEGYNNIGPITVALDAAANALKKAGDESAQTVRNLTERFFSLHSQLENVLGFDATR